MRFDQIDILVMLSRVFGGLMIAGGAVGGFVAAMAAGPRSDPALWPWVALALSGLWLVNFCTGVLAQIETARAAQDSLQELRAIKDAIKAKSA